eukprot:gene12281-biopygen2411
MLGAAVPVGVAERGTRMCPNHLLHKRHKWANGCCQSPLRQRRRRRGSLRTGRSLIAQPPIPPIAEQKCGSK